MLAILFLALIILAIALIFLYRIPIPNISPQLPPNQNVNTNLTSISNQSVPLTQATSPSNSSSGDAIRRPVGTVSVYSLPRNVQSHLTAGVQTVPLRNINVPSEFDARQKWTGVDTKGRTISMITGPLDQVQCGSCWAFSTALVFSDRWRINHPNDPELRILFNYLPNNGQTIDGSSIEQYSVLNNISPYQLISCDLCSPPGQSQDPDGRDSLCNYGCSGGAIADAFDYLMHRGANSIYFTKPAAPDPLNANTFKCDFNPNSTVYQATNKYVVAQANPDGSIPQPDNREMAIKEDIFLHGPVSAAFTVYQSLYSFFEQNPTGIYGTQPQQSDAIVGGHAVTIIGWGGTGDNRYWIIRNSWGQQWGDQGFFKIKWNWTPPDSRDRQNQRTLGIMDEVWAITAP